jgi:hypothetical protein
VGHPSGICPSPAPVGGGPGREENEVWVNLRRAFIYQLNQQECFMDGSFAPAKKWGSVSGNQEGRRKSGWW